MPSLKTTEIAPNRSANAIADAPQSLKKPPNSDEQFYRLILGNADGMLVVDKKGHIQLANPAAEVLLGMSNDTLMGAPFGFPVMAGEKTEVDVRSHTGKPLVAELRTAEIAWEKQPAFLISLRDITDRKALEHSLKVRTDELELSVSELEAFSHMISHDLWNHMRRIDQLNQALWEGEKEVMSDRAEAQITQIQDICQRTRTTIEGMLQFSRVSHMEMACAQLPMLPLVTELAEQMKLVYGDRNFQGPKTNRTKIYGDKRLLRVAIDNLLENAWKYTRDITNPRVEFGQRSPSRWPKDMPPEAKQPNYGVFFVKDNGIGFNMSEIDDLFLPFRRLPSATTFEGNGLGLTTVQRIIHRHRGHIWARGHVGKGVTIFFTLPTALWLENS